MQSMGHAARPAWHSHRAFRSEWFALLSFIDLSIRQLGAELRARRLTARALVDDCLARIDRLNPLINAFTFIDGKGARAAAALSDALLDANAARGPLEGIPCALKDNLVARGLPATWGSRLFENRIGEHDEVPVARLRAAGAIFLGKTNVPEFTLRGYTANALHGVTGNPWNPALTPGGSSGGAVAAVAAGMAPFALATDGGGSIRRPAAHTGLVGLKPGRDIAPRGRGFPEINFDFEVVGPITRRVDDARLVLDHLRRDTRTSPHSHAPRRILCVETIDGAPVDPDIRASFADAVEQLIGLGHIVERGPLPVDIARAVEVMPIFSSSGLAMIAHERADFDALVGADFVAAARDGEKRAAREVMAAIETIKRFRADVEAQCAAFDIIATPATAAQPWPAAAEYPPVIDGHAVGPRGHAIFTGWVNACGRPAISVPMKPAPDGMPIGLQLIGPPGSDDMLLDLAESIEAIFGGPRRWPTMAA
jgi:aspartyl-tRNA(Asn)/glutamyl-tRNA(Gln) amidotransferase subunit A